MRVRNYCSKSVFRLLGLSVLVLLSACSNNASDDSNTSKLKSVDGVSIKSKGPSAKDKSNQHTHPSNPCTAAVAHSHVFTVKEHEHSYDCESTNEFVNNAHIHPATKKSRKFRHVHPNGASEHSHHKE